MQHCVQKKGKAALGLYGVLKKRCINGDEVDVECYEPFVDQGTCKHQLYDGLQEGKIDLSVRTSMNGWTDCTSCPIVEYNKACALYLRAMAWEKRGYLVKAQVDVYRAYKVLGALVSKEQYSLCLTGQWQRHVNRILRRSERGWSDLFKRPSPYQVLNAYVDSLRLCSRLSQEAGDLIESMKFTNEV